MYTFLCGHVFSVLLAIFPGVELLGSNGNSDISSNHQRPNSRYLGKKEVGQGQKADE